MSHKFTPISKEIYKLLMLKIIWPITYKINSTKLTKKGFGRHTGINMKLSLLDNKTNLEKVCGTGVCMTVSKSLSAQA